LGRPTIPACNAILVTGYWLLVTGYWLLVTGYWFQGRKDSKSSILIFPRNCLKHGIP